MYAINNNIKPTVMKLLDYKSFCLFIANLIMFVEVYFLLWFHKL
jgi:hypothetical protein